MASQSAMGTLLTSFQFGGVTTRRRVQLSLLAAVALPMIFSMVQIGISQLAGTLNTAPEGGNERVTEFFVNLFVLGLPIFVVAQLPLWWKRTVHAEIYEQGFGSGGRFWRWSEVDRLAVSPDGTMCALYSGGDLMFETAGDTASLNDFRRLLEQKTSEAWLPRLLEAYQSGEKLRFGNFSLSREGVWQNDVRLPLAELHDYVAEEKESRIALRRPKGVAAMVIILRGLPNAHLLSPLLTHIFPNGRINQEVSA